MGNCWRKSRFTFLFSCIQSWPPPGAELYRRTSHIRLFYWQLTFIFLSSTEQRGYVRLEIPFVPVRCRVAFSRIIHNPSPRDCRGPAEGFWTSLVCRFYSPTIHLKEAHNKRWCSLRSHVRGVEGKAGGGSIGMAQKSLRSYWWNKFSHHCYVMT